MGLVRAMGDDEVRLWLMEGDPAVRWRVLAHLDEAPPDQVAAERARVGEVGWGARLLDVQDREGTWSGALYSPKWVSTTYTLLHLMWLGLPAGHPSAHRGLDRLWEWRGRWVPETCIQSMLIRLTATFDYPSTGLDPLVDDLLAQQQDDGGWNCETRTDRAKHSSFHTSVQALEALGAYQRAGGAIDVRDALRGGLEFFGRHRLYLSHRTGEVAIPASTRFPAFPEWHFDVLRGLELFAALDVLDPRLADGIELVRSRGRPDGSWHTYAPSAGRHWFRLEESGRSRWTTVRALAVLRWWEAFTASTQVA